MVFLFTVLDLFLGSTLPPNLSSSGSFLRPRSSAVYSLLASFSLCSVAFNYREESISDNIPPTPSAYFFF